MMKINDIIDLPHEQNNANVGHVCDKCNKSFRYNSDYKRHIDRKNSCQKEEKQLQFKQRKTCEYCNKIFARSDALPKHLLICKSKLVKDKGTEKDKEKEIILKQFMDEMQAMRQQIAELKEHKTIVNGNIIEGDMNNTTNNTNNLQQNIHNDIKIIAYGKEDLSFITNENYELILNKGFKSVPHLVEYIHLNQNMPQNQNIYISNVRDKYILIFDGKQWQLKERDDVLQEMIENNTDILSEKFDELVDTLDESTVAKFKRFLNEKDENRIINQIKEDLKLMLYNKKLITEIKPRLPYNSQNKKIIPNVDNKSKDEPVNDLVVLDSVHPDNKPDNNHESDSTNDSDEIIIVTNKKRNINKKIL